MNFKITALFAASLTFQNIAALRYRLTMKTGSGQAVGSAECEENTLVKLPWVLALPDGQFLQGTPWVSVARLKPNEEPMTKVYSGETPPGFELSKELIREGLDIEYPQGKAAGNTGVMHNCPVRTGEGPARKRMRYDHQFYS
ncbi:hypothetical protein PspLS_06160 [Pyricularia sp. CBS 133598]|nr:hypothetical protein PspLS_06160 [Pyricularia sp. CBS 133598]